MSYNRNCSRTAPEDLRSFFNGEDGTKRPTISRPGKPHTPENCHRYSGRAPFGANETF